MSGVVRNIYNTLYNRPTVRLEGYTALHGLPGELLAYLNYGGATGSAKDALAEGMLALAMERGQLRAGQPVIEASSGTFAVALTIAAIHSGHPVHLVMPGTVTPDRQRMFTGLGATVVLTNYVYGRAGTLRRAQQLAEEVDGYFVNYFSNDDNPEYHRRVTGPAILKAVDGKLDAIVAGVGSGGTLTGVGEYLKAWAGTVWTVAVQPFESQSLTGGFSGRHGINGIGSGFVPDNYNPYIVDEVVSVATGDAVAAAREVLATDAVPAAVSCGAVLCAARELQKRRTGRVLCIFNGMAVVE
ncbi:cysteine synthase family protein [Ruminococcaceae bacterium OttesenSCG-928-D13]|nr:cysteine synthase family protein [Ruminococcaceae bacterium OttesenSCG-928-D13]